MWIPDLFMKRVEANEDWSLFHLMKQKTFMKHMVKSLKNFMKNTKRGKARKTVKAQDLWFGILKQIMVNIHII